LLAFSSRRPSPSQVCAALIMLVPIPCTSQAATASFPAISTVACSRLSGKQVHHAASCCLTVLQQTVPCKQ
jgi:hypothetical protein